MNSEDNNHERLKKKKNRAKNQCYTSAWPVEAASTQAHWASPYLRNRECPIRSTAMIRCEGQHPDHNTEIYTAAVF